ncbi:hypothetical protein EYF80_038129 [Liparis tanakae]|uniref:Uncharacterized protein n=1 Tax=Liparis tanakae TaxID=230148 RepID=A0A4Z2GE70_9TELE|nr:hypothetical protein EYF80_038129 [Liparis tanakae]
MDSNSQSQQGRRSQGCCPAERDRANYPGRTGMREDKGEEQRRRKNVASILSRRVTCRVESLCLFNVCWWRSIQCDGVEIAVWGIIMRAIKERFTGRPVSGVSTVPTLQRCTVLGHQ